MSTNVTVGGSTYPVPLYGETGWAQGSGNLSQLLIALAAVSAGSAFMQISSATTTPITGSSTRTYLVNTGTLAITINLPSPDANTWLMIKDIIGNAGTNNITLHRHGSETIDGVAADKILTIPYELCMIVADGTNWYVLLEI